MQTFSAGYTTAYERDKLFSSVCKVEHDGNKLSAATVQAYMRLVVCTGGKDRTTIGWGRLADDINVHYRTIERIRARLTAAGLIAYRGGVTYLLLHPVAIEWLKWKKNRKKGGLHNEKGQANTEKNYLGQEGTVKEIKILPDTGDRHQFSGIGGRESDVPGFLYDSGRQGESGDMAAAEGHTGDLGKGSELDAGGWAAGVCGVEGESATGAATTSMGAVGDGRCVERHAKVTH